MKLDDIKNKTILLFGKPRAFDQEEFLYQLQQCEVKLVKEYDAGVDLIVEGRLITPYEQNAFDGLYELGLKEKFVSIDEFELTLIQNIDADTLLMSLKLSHDKDRLLAYIKNSAISDTLFLRLIALYDWRGEGFFESDENRDVTAALICRFYKNIERNHNVQYATLGLMHLVEQSEDPRLIEALSVLTPIKKGFNDPLLIPVILSIAKNPATPNSVLKSFLKSGDKNIRFLIASRDGLDPSLQKMILLLKDALLNEALCSNAALEHTLAEELATVHGKSIARHILLDKKIFEFLAQTFAHDLALNPSLTCKMQQSLFSLGDRDVIALLASNKNLDSSLLEPIIALKDEVVNLAFFANSNV